MHNESTRKKRSKGIAIVLTTLTLSITLPLAGLGFDVATLYLIKSKLGAAADSASLAGARALSQGATQGAQTASAIGTAQSYFSGNFPAGYWRTTGASATVTVDDTSIPNYRSVNVNATVQAPLYFLRVFNQQASTINVTATAGRRDVLMMMVLDRSSSMNGVVAGTGQTACALMKVDAANFVSYFAPGRDQIGLVAFGSSVYFYPSTTNFTTPDANGNTIPSLIGQLTCNENTSSAAAIARAYQELTAVNNPNRMNVIMFMTDGRPNGVTADYSTVQVNGKCSLPVGTPGVIAQWAGGAVTSGNTAGVMSATTTSITFPNDGYGISGSSNCQFNQSNNTALTNVRSDIPNLPATDYFNNSTLGPYSQANSATWPYTTPFNPVGAVSIPQQIVVASANVLDNEATQVRTNTTLNPFIYDIALMGNGPVDDMPDTLLLQKIANDPALAGQTGIGQTFYQQQINQPHGYFAIAPNASQLGVAFDTIAEQISIRLAR
ncbi:MAG TPA: VWA domain-containing protein [Bryobacteraceae bacterium]|nr:VWA domain-containing protein [Bryobacteraceae bacterium]